MNETDARSEQAEAIAPEQSPVDPSPGADTRTAVDTEPTESNRMRWRFPRLFGYRGGAKDGSHSLLGPVLTLIGGLVAAGVGYYTADRRSAHQAKEDAEMTITRAQLESQGSQTAFARDQKRLAYSTFLNALNDYVAGVDHNVFEDFNKFYTKPPSGYLATPMTSAKIDDFNHALNLVRLFGIGPAADDASNLFSLASNFWSDVASWHDKHVPIDANSPCQDQKDFYNNIYVKEHNQIVDGIESFNDHARTDLKLDTRPAPQSHWDPLGDDFCG